MILPRKRQAEEKAF